MSETIDFKFSKPVLLTLAFADGKPVSSRYPGSIRTMRTTKDARVFFCDPQLEAKITALNPASGVQLEITKLERENAKGCDWKVERIGNQKDGTYKIPKADPATSPEIPESASSCQGVAIGPPQNITTLRKPPTEAESHCYRLVDLMAATVRYAKDRHGALVREEDARTIAITVYIQAARSGMIRRRPAQQRRAG